MNTLRLILTAILLGFAVALILDTARMPGGLFGPGLAESRGAR